MAKILIVDDEEILRNMYKTKFVNRGYEVVTAENGLIGLDIAISQKPILILLDIRMPIMDGVTMMQKLREDSWGKDVPIIILSVIEPDVEKILEDVAKGKPAYYLEKASTTPEQVFEKVEEIINLFKD